MNKKIKVKIFCGAVILLCGFIYPGNIQHAIAAGPVISNISVDSISHTTARIQWNTSVPSTKTRVLYDSVDSSSPFESATQHKNGSPQIIQGYTLGGLAPSTTYYYQVCSTAAATNEETCGPVGQFTTTASPSNRFQAPALPNAPTLPAMPSINGQTFTVVADCSNFQSLLNQAAALPGASNHQILIAPTTTCFGNYNLPRRVGTGWIVVRTSAADNTLPAEGNRISNAYASVMPVISAKDNYQNPLGGAFYISEGTSKWRFVGLKITAGPGPHGNLVAIPYGTTADMIFDRDIFYTDGSNGDDVSTAIYANGIRTIIANSSITTIRPGSFSLGIEMTSAQGLLIDNNYINAPGISIFAQEDAPFGHNAPQGSDYKISRNLFEWDERYKNNSVTRQHLEFKGGNRILIDGNIFRNQWNGGVTGTFSNVMVFTPRNGISPAGFNNSISDLTITNNVLYDVSGGINLAGAQNNLVVTDVPATKRVLIKNNLFYKIDGGYAKNGVYGAGVPFFFDYALEDVVVDHNTVFNNRGLWTPFLAWIGGPGAGIKFTNNILPANYSNSLGNVFWTQDTQGQLPPPDSGSSGPRGVLSGISLASPNPDPTFSFANNLIIPGVTDTGLEGYYNDSSKAYSPASCLSYWSYFTSTACAGNGSTNTANEVFSSVGFSGPLTTLLGFQLNSSSSFKNSAQGGTDPGVDMTTLNSATANTVSGTQSQVPALIPTLNVSTANFGSLPVGATSSGLMFTLNNPTAGFIGVSNVSVTGDFTIANNYCNFGTQPNTHCDVTIVFTPTATGPRVGTVTFALSGSSVSSLNVALSGVGLEKKGPTISSLATSGITQTEVVISWTTDEPSDSQVEYGLTSQYGITTAVNTTLATSHSRKLVSLSPNTTYNYRVKSNNAAGNLSTSLNSTFTTLALVGTTSTTTTPLPQPVPPANPPVSGLPTSTPAPIATTTPVSQISLVTPISNIKPPNLKRNLSRGMSDADVILLQDYLKQRGFLDASVQTTLYFGNLTELAVKKLQQVNNIEATGIVGPLTRASISSGQASSGTGTLQATTPPVSTYSKAPAPVYSGMKNQDVVRLQNILKRLGFFPATVASSGTFGPTTKKAVQSFQRTYNIVSTGTESTTGYGRVGPATWKKLLSL